MTFAEILLVIDDSEALAKVEEWDNNKKWGEIEDKLSMCFSNLESQERTNKINEEIEVGKEIILKYNKLFTFIKLLLSSEHSEVRAQALRSTSDYVNNFNVYSRDQLKAIIELWMYITKRFRKEAFNHIDDENILMSILYKNNLTFKLQAIVEDADIEIIKELLIKTECPEIISPLINRIIYSQTKNQDQDNMVLSIQTLKEIQLGYLKNYTTQNLEIDDNCFKIFYGCIEAINENTKKVTLAKEALSIMRNFIKLYPQGYINLFIRTGKTSNEQFNRISPEPCWRQLFQSAENFEKFLFNKKLDTCDKIECVRNYWQLYKYNKYSSIEFTNQGVVTKIIDSNFINEIEKLEKLIQVKAELKELTNNIENKEWAKGIAYQKLEEIKNKFKVIDLYISLNGEIREQINKIESDLKS